MSVHKKKRPASKRDAFLNFILAIADYFMSTRRSAIIELPT